MLVEFAVENCMNVDACNVITKREYNVQVDFIPSMSDLPMRTRNGKINKNLI